MAERALADAFARGASEKRALLMPFFVCGYPDRETFLACVRAAAEAGADAMEIGIPFSDPIMDGPVIAQVSSDVLARGQRVDDAMAMLADASAATGVPLLPMTYYNVVYRRGLEAFATQAASAGGAGVIIPDLSVEDAGPWRSAAAAAGIAPIFMASQVSPEERIRAIGTVASGFVYAASMLGVTGVRTSLATEAKDLVERIRAHTAVPVAVGVGVSTPEHAAEVASYADGVIVGSALVKRIVEASDPVEATGAFIADLRAACVR